MSKIVIIDGNSNDKDQVRNFMVKGEPGVSPTVETSKTGSVTTVTITDAEGTHTATIDDGVSPTVETSKTGGVTTITITDAEGTHTATINDGELTYDDTFCTLNSAVSISSGSTKTWSATLPTGFNISNTRLISFGFQGDAGTEYFAEGSLNTSNLEKKVYINYDNTDNSSKVYVELKNTGVSNIGGTIMITCMKVR